MYIEFIIIYVLLAISISISVVSLIFTIKCSNNSNGIISPINNPVSKDISDHSNNVAGTNSVSNINNRENIGVVFCTKCGNSYAANESFCPKCGQHRG